MTRKPDPGLESRSQPNPALAKWAAAGLHEVTLPTGTRVKVRIPAPEAIVRDSALPQDLRRMALKFAVSRVNLEDAEPEELEGFLQLTAQLTSLCVRAIWNGDEWEPVSLSAQDIEALDLPPEDMTAIEAIALRRATPAAITADSQRALGQLSEAEANEIKREEAGGTVDAFGPFREQSGGPADGATGDEVRAAPKRDDRNRRSAHSAAGGRRSSSAAAGP